jgi:hypothetical protein
MNAPSNLPATWRDVEHWQVADLAALPVSVLATLADEIKMMEARAKSCKAMLGAVVQAKYSFDANDTGTQRLHDGEIDVVVNVPKSVSWDQDKLNEVFNNLTNMGEDAHEYIDIKASVSETKYKAWPESLRTMFEPARTVKPGSPSIKFERKGGK